MRRSLVILGLTGALVLPGAAARAGGGFCHNDTQTERSGTVVVYRDFCPTPTILHVNVGQTVTWRNADDFDHTVTSGFGGWAMQTLGAQQTFSHRFGVAGSYAYYCMIHPNMGGIVVVGPQAAPSQAAATTPVASTTSSSGGFVALAGILGLLVGGAGVGLRARRNGSGSNGNGGKQP